MILIGASSEGRGKLIMAKKTLIISQNFYPEIGSAGNRIKNIYKQLTAKGEQVNVLTTSPTYPNRNIYDDKQFWDDESLNQECENVTRITVTNKKYSSSIINRLFYYLEIAFKMILFILRDKNTYDIVFVSSPPIFIGLVGLIAKRRYKAKLITDIRDLWPESLKGVGVFNYTFILYIFGLLEKLLYKTSDEIIVNSKGFIDHIHTKANTPKEKITHIPNAAIEEEIYSVSKNHDEFKVIYAGNIGLAQDEKILMDLARILTDYNIQLTIIGYGYNRQLLEQTIKEHELKNVQFIKPKTRKHTLELIRQHDIGIVTLNDKEVFDTVLPGKVIDYMTCGVPIVASVSGFSKEVIQKAEAGYVSDSKKADEMTEKILYLYKNPNEKERLSLNAISYVREHYRWENNIESLVGLINRKPIKKENEGK